MTKLIPILLLLAPAWGCGGETAPMPEAESATAPSGTMETAPPEGDVPGPISSRGGSVSSVPMGDGSGESPLQFDLPAGWEAQAPESPMRMAQAAIPGPGGAGQLAVFYFGAGQGGDVEANLERWVGQIEMAPGTSPERGTFEANGLRVTWVDVAGTLQPSTMGMGPSTAQPGSRLLGAVVEGPGGPWFFKATGPEATLAAEREDFLGMLRAARVP